MCHRYFTLWAYYYSIINLPTTDPATGDEISYAYDKLNVKYPFALELRGSNFIVDKSEIPKSFAEVWNGVVAMFSEIEKLEN